MSTQRNETGRSDARKADRNEDPISGESGAHPVGAGLGAGLAGAATGAAAGLAAGPIGTVVGTIVGGVAGGLAGKAIAEKVDPTVENEYWQKQHATRPYFKDEYSYKHYQPAYRAGWETFDPNQPSDWTDREIEARRRWESEGGHTAMSWEEARFAAEDAYTRVNRRSTDTADRT